jgi:hypothetical protein
VAKVNGRRRERGSDDRGQLILVAGIALALLFVALALLVNAAIYTDNLATRDGDSAAEPLEYQASVVDSVGGLIDAENAAGGHSDVGSIQTAVEAGIVSIDDSLDTMSLRRGAVTHVDAESVGDDLTDGLLIRRTESGSFDNWEVSDATGVRSFEISFEPDHMPALNPDEDSPFTIDLDGRTLYVYKDAAPDPNELIVAEPSGETVCTTSVSTTVRFDVTRERFGGESCRLGWSSIDGPVSISNGTNAHGTYNATIASDADPSELPDEVDAVEALYSVNRLGIRIDTPKLRYETTVRIAPGEPDV